MNDKQLLIIGEDNFDYYLTQDRAIKSIPKVEGCSESYMGKINHVKILIDKGYIKGEFIELGKEVFKE